LIKKKSKIGINKNEKISKIILAKIYIKNKMLKLEKAKIKDNQLMSSQLHFKKPTASVKGIGVWGIGFFLLTSKEEKPIIDLYQSPEQQTPPLYILYIIYSGGGVCSGTW
jgi:hypothetical protein